MGQDLREMFKNEREAKAPQMKDGHEARFLERLEVDLPKKDRAPRYYYAMAASVLLLLSMGFLGYYVLDRESQGDPAIVNDTGTQNDIQGISLGNLSPDLKKVEDYYMASINLELSQLDVSEDNKMLVDNFMNRLADLNLEYKRLNDELNQIGPNDHTITALIKNLQLRLQLLQKLKLKLNDLKSSKNEQIKQSTL